MAGALVGSVGAIATGTTSIAPAFGQATTTGHCLIARLVWVGSNAITTTASGWSQAFTQANGTATKTAIWFKPNSAAGETAPTFTSTSATYMAGDLSEWSGLDTTSPLDQTGGATGSSTGPGTSLSADAATGDVQIAVVGTSTNKSGTLTFTDGWSPAATPAGSAQGTGTTSNTKHAWFSANIGNGNGAYNFLTISASQTWAIAMATFKTPPVPPNAPTGLQVYSGAASPSGGPAMTGQQLYLNWIYSSQGTGVYYDVYRSTDQTNWSLIATVAPGSGHAYTDSGPSLTIGTTFYYYLTARNSAGTANSTVASGVPTVFTRSNSFEGGTPGTTFVYSGTGGASGDPWDLTMQGGTYVSTAAHGSVAVQLGNNYPIGTWYVPGSVLNVWGRVYFQFQGTSFAYNICSYFDAAGTEVVRYWINNGVLGIYQSTAGSWTAPGTPSGTFSTTLAINTWYRLETQAASANNAPIGRLYAGADLDTTNITETVTPSSGTWYSGQSLAKFCIGGSNSGNYVLIDDAAAGVSGWIGPYTAPSGGGGGPTPTEGGSGLRVISKMR